MMMVLAVLGIAIVCAFALVVLAIIAVFASSPQRGMALMSALAMLGRSWAKSVQHAKQKPQTHRRTTDPPNLEHEHHRQHRRTPRPSMMMTLRDPQLLKDFLEKEERRESR